MRRPIVSTVFAGILVGTAGCTIYTAPPPPPPVAVGPVVEGPGVEVIEVEPPPGERVYVYDPGYPPGTYFYGGNYYYGGYYYPREVFVNEYVVENVRQNRYIDVEANRREGQVAEGRQRAEFARTGGRPQRPANPRVGGPPPRSAPQPQRDPRRPPQ